MVIVTDPAEITGITDPAIRRLLELRFKQLQSPDLSNVQEGGAVEFIVVETADAVSEIEQAAGFPILTGLFDDLPFDHPDFYPCHEYLEEHHYEQCRIYEMVFIGNDDGAATTILIPAEKGIDANLLAMCRSWAKPAMKPL